MKRAVALLVTISLLASAAPADDAQRFWPQWRGPTGTGVAPFGQPLTEWGEGENVRWKKSLPGLGSSTPAVWGQRLYVTTAVPFGDPVAADPIPERAGRRGPRGSRPTHRHRFLVLAIDRATGDTVWEAAVLEDLPHEGTHEFGNYAAASPITDGERIWAFFGSRGLFCLDMDGTVLWERDLGDQETHLGFGEGASPVVHGDLIVVPWDHNGQSFVVALDKATGDEVWRGDRDEGTAWSTPLVVERGGVAQVITNATQKVRSYELATGSLLWESRGMTRNVIPSPVEHDGIVYVMSGFRGSALQAIRLDAAEGDVSESQAIVWQMSRDTPYTPSPLLVDGTLFFLKGNSNVLSAVDAATGERRYIERLDALADVFSSPVAAGGHVFVTGRRGTTVVLSHGPEFEVIATNSLDDEFDASMVIVDGEIYLRGRHLYRISE